MPRPKSNPGRPQRTLGGSPSLRGRQGLSDQEVEYLARAQNFLCAACAGPLIEPQVDHDHEVALTHPHPPSRGCRACVRGLLDRRCNSVLGFAQDSPETLRSLADYIERARALR